MSLRRKKDKESFSLDLTSCSDIIFTLLLFYILTQNFIPQTQLKLPPIENPAQLEENKIHRIEISENGSLTLNNALFTLNEIPDINANDNRQVVIFAHKAAPAGVCIELLDKLRAKGIESVSFAGSVPVEEQNSNETTN